MEKVKEFIKNNFIYLIIIVVVLFIKLFVFSPIRVNGDSMYSTLHDGDIMILNEYQYFFNDIERFDIVVVETDTE